MKTQPTQPTKIKRYVLIDQNDKSVYETTSFNELLEIANTAQLLKIYEVFWIGERRDDNIVSIWHEYRKSGHHQAVVCDVETIHPNEDNLQVLLEDINYYSNRKEIKKDLLEDLKERRENSGDKEHFDKKIKELKKIFKKNKEDKLYVCHMTGAIVKKVGKTYRAIGSLGRPEKCIKAVIIKHDSCDEEVGCTYEYGLRCLSRIRK